MLVVNMKVFVNLSFFCFFFGSMTFIMLSMLEFLSI